MTADNQINLLAAQNTSSQTSTNSNSSGSIGMSVGGNPGVAVAASKGKGKSNGADTTYTNTTLTAGNTATLKSGGDTAVKGAVVSANQIKADIGQKYGGNLNIESLQDKSTYSSSQQSAGGSITFGPGGVPTGGSISASKSKINSNFESVNQQSGFKAGDGGFQVSVANNTNLTGGVISSSQAAVDSKANTFTTGGALTLTDVQNTASFKGTAVGGTIGVGSQLSSSGAGVGNTKGSSASTSSAGISGVAGNTAVRTGDKETGLKPIFNADKVQKDIDAQVKITTAFGQQAVPAWGAYSNNKFAAAVAAGDEQAIKCWGPDGPCRAGGHALIGGLTGGVGGALGAGLSSVAAPHVQAFFTSQGVPLQAAQALTQLSAIGMGAGVGSTAGAVSGINESSGNAVLAIPWLVETIMVGGPIAARACMASPACQRALYLGGATVFAAVAAIATPPLASNNTGNTTPLPNYGGPTTTPIAAPPDTNSTTSPADQPRPVVTTGGSVTPVPVGSTAVGGGFAAGSTVNVPSIVFANPKPPGVLEPITNPPQQPSIPADWTSRPGREPGSTIYFPLGSDPSRGGEYIRVMPPGSSAVADLSVGGYWVRINSNGQPVDPSTGRPARGRGDSHIPIPIPAPKK